MEGDPSHCSNPPDGNSAVSFHQVPDTGHGSFARCGCWSSRSLVVFDGLSALLETPYPPIDNRFRWCTTSVNLLQRLNNPPRLPTKLG
ncbi:hypothetical protein M513_07932 [Trichuris suis]|uniref:Uncharacterized protein n=1 Tax=Trichuris suis TaxID=68888 RepID=A0A085M1S2_9BILA|nr:hypothetical protein M513_07932 [Trichuris suis]